MASISFLGGHFRKLWHIEQEEFRDHLLRLDGTSRRSRFGAEVSDDYIERYAATALDDNCRVWGFFGPRGNLRGAGELKRFTEETTSAEAAFTVEVPYRGRGIGTELFNRVVLSARNRKVRHLYVNCLRENKEMQSIARKFDAVLVFDHSDVMGDLAPPSSTALTRLEEAFDDSSGFVFGVLDIQQRLLLRPSKS